MTSMVERVARAIDDAASNYLKEHEEKAKKDATIIPCIGMADIPPSVLARAAIEAMREPTDGMYSAYIDGYFDELDKMRKSGKFKPQDEPSACFKAAFSSLVDAALKEAP